MEDSIIHKKNKKKNNKMSFIKKIGHSFTNIRIFMRETIATCTLNNNFNIIKQ